jgi:hypothetical protein
MLVLEQALRDALGGRRHLGEYIASGLDEPVIEVAGNNEDRKLALDVLRELARR